MNRKKQWLECVEAIRSSGYFDANWYMETYPDVRELAVDPAEHFLRWGARMGRDPGPAFSTADYVVRHPQIGESRLNPLLHFLNGKGSLPRRSRLMESWRPNFDRQQVDVVVPVYNALDDVRECLMSLQRRTDGCDVNVIIVNDGSGFDTSQWLREFCGESRMTLIEHEVNLGYTKAVNTGLRASRASFVITLNSDTVVASGWLRGLLRCMASDPSIGIVGPLSNAASWQNVPELLDANGQFAVNTLDDAMTADDMARVVASASRRAYPRVPFVNGFCFMIRREVIDAIGVMDEERFPVGYGEENDFCIRASDAGFILAIADDAYVFHAKSKSFGHERRKELSSQGSETLRLKHGVEKFKRLVDRVKDRRAMDAVRSRIKERLAATSAAAPMPIDKMKILFLLPVQGGSGGAHSVIQEVMAMRRLGADVYVAVREANVRSFEEQYADIPEISQALLGFEESRVVELADEFDVVVGTIFSSMSLVAEITEALPHILPAYYVQDYEPLFFDEGSANWNAACRSYELVDNCLLFAKTHWLVNKVWEQHAKLVQKVEPSIDHEVYRPVARPTRRTLHVSAMIRPKTPRRGAARTMRVLQRMVQAFPGRIIVDIFGCTSEEILDMEDDFEWTNHGVLDRPGVSELLAQSDVFIDLSDYQAFGRTALEAMACGCAAMVPVHGGADEYAIDGHNSLVVDSFDVEECCRRLEALLSDGDALSRMRLAALRTVSRYSTHRAAVSEVDLFARKLSEHRARFPAPDRRRLVIVPAVQKDAVTPTGSAWVRYLKPYKSPLVRTRWLTRVSTALPPPGSAELVMVQRQGPKIPLDEIQPWCDAWRTAGGRVVYDLDDDLTDAEALAARGYQGDAEELASRVKSWAGSADLTITSTDALSALVSGIARRSVVIPNRLDGTQWMLDQPMPDQAERRAMEGGPIVIGYVGSESHRPDLDVIRSAVLEIVERYGRHVLVEIIGVFQNGRPTFGKRVGLPRRNEYPQFVSWLFQRAHWDIALLPLVDDGFNTAKSHLKFLEYAALGTPIICSDVPSYRGVATDHVNALVVPNSHEAWVGGLEKLIESSTLRQRLALAARRLVAADFTIGSATDYVDALEMAWSAGRTSSASESNEGIGHE